MPGTLFPPSLHTACDLSVSLSFCEKQALSFQMPRLLCPLGEAILGPLPPGIATTQKVVVWGKRWTGI